MNKTWLIMKAEIRAALGRKTFIVLAFGLPVLLGIVALAYMVTYFVAGLLVIARRA